MMRKHAIVLALSFVLVGMMFFSVDTPLIMNQHETSQNIPSPQEVSLISDEPDSMGNMRMNVMENPSFEDWAGNAPEGYPSYLASSHRYADFAYSGPGVSGNYALLIEAQGSATSYAEGLVWPESMSTPTPLVKPGMSLSFNWNTLASPDIGPGPQSATVRIEVNTRNSTGNYRNLYYVLSDGHFPNNGSITKNIWMNDTLNQWHSFDRNITEDFIEAFGDGAISSSHYISWIWLRTYSPVGGSGKLQAVFDNVVLTNGSYSGWLGNGDFETGVEGPWDTSETSLGYIEQSLDSTHETYSLNLSIPEVTSGDGTSYVRKALDHPGGYFASAPGMTVIDFDWKYNDTPSAGSSQYCFVDMMFINSTSAYYIYLYLGISSDITPSNASFLQYMKAPGFGVRDTWQHSSLDLFDYLNYAGYTNVSLYQLTFYARSGDQGAALEVLLDDFSIETYPMGDPGFEADWYSGSDTPFAGWTRWNGETGVISRTTDSLLGNYACNLTVTGSDSAGVYRNSYIPVNPSDFMNFSWRLDDMGVSTSHVDIDIRFTAGHHLSYILGSGASYNPTNLSTYKYIRADSFNVTDVWNQFVVNIAADAEEAFSLSSDLVIDQIIIESFSAPGERVSCIFDEMHFIDGVPPVVDLVTFLPSTPMYYESVKVTIWAHDDRSGIDQVYVDYNNGTGWYSLPAIPTISNYTVEIPAQAYGTTVDFQISATDNGGQNILDNNGGAFYTYTVGDDVDPTLTIDNPVNNTDEEGLLAITATADDLGSGVEYVSFNPDGGGAIEDYSAPYSQNWNLDDASLGSHFIIVTVRDLAGNTASKTHYITVVDTIPPVLDTPSDVEYTVGETGHVIDWNPTDPKPNTYEVFVDTVSTYTGSWNSSSEHIIINLDGLAVGTYNFTCVVYDDAGHSYSDTVNVTVIEAATTTTTTTSTTTTSTTPTSGTTTPPPTGGDMTMTIVLVAGAGVVILLVIVVILKKK